MRLLRTCQGEHTSSRGNKYGLGDKAYVGCPEYLTEIKGSNVSRSVMEYNLTIQHYRAPRPQ